jgi:hypothetical protein
MRRSEQANAYSAGTSVLVSFFSDGGEQAWALQLKENDKTDENP